ncbi:MAG: hypothetical protein KDC05_02700 [Bacteroidales bacterium]|nr:hypothetical protein [Bacteroidales bacterium]
MKRWILILFVLSGLTIFAQDDTQEFSTIFGSNFESGGYGAPELKLGQVNDEMSLFVGGRGGWIIGHKFVLGGAGYGLTTNNTFNSIEMVTDSLGNSAMADRKLKIDMGYGGLLLEYIAMPKKAIHLAFPLIIAAGGASVGEKVDSDPNNQDPAEWTSYNYIESSAFFLVEPGVNLELNMVKFFRLNIGASYRFVSGTNMVRLNNSDLSDFTFNLALKFGMF